jgi:hypothetical protein
MIEAHYSAHIADAMDEIAARAIVPLTNSASDGGLNHAVGGIAIRMD